MCPMVSPVPEVSTLILPVETRTAQVSPVLPGCLGAMPCSCGVGVGLCAGPVYVRGGVGFGVGVGVGGGGVGVGVGVGVALQQLSPGLLYFLINLSFSRATSPAAKVVLGHQAMVSPPSKVKVCVLR